MATTNSANVEKLYVAYFNRPADAAGLEFWQGVVAAANGDTRAVSAEFANSAEYKMHYAGMDNYQVVTEVYKNLFGRAPETAGLEYWVKGMAAKLFTIDDAVTAIAAGAQGSDQTAYNNKVTAATAFTAALDTPEEISTYAAGSVEINQRAKDFLSAITDDASLAKVLASVDLNNSVQTVLGTGTPVATTPSVPTTPTTPTTPAPIEVAPGDTVVVGSTKGDTIVAGGDLGSNGPVSIDGGAGNDAISVIGTASGVALGSTVSVKNVEKLDIGNTTGDVSADLSTWQGLQHVDVMQASGGTVNVTTNGNLQTIGVTGGHVTLTDSAIGPAATLASATLNDYSGIATINSDALTSLNLSNAASGVTVNAAAGTRELTLSVNAVTAAAPITDATATTIKVDAAGVASSLTLATDAATNLNVTGDHKVSIALSDLGNNIVTLGTITSTNSAGVTINSQLGSDVVFNGGAGADAITIGASTTAIDMGAGDDTVTVTSMLGSGGTVTGGDGVDTLAMSAATAATLSAVPGFANAATGFEKLAIGAVTGVGNSATVALDNMGTTNYVASAGTGTPVTYEIEKFNMPTAYLGTTATVGGVTATVVNATSVSGADLASAIAGTYTGSNILVSGAPAPGWAVTASGNVAVFTAIAEGNQTDLTKSIALAPAATGFVATTTDGSATMTETSVVKLSAMSAGQTVSMGNFKLTAYNALTLDQVKSALLGQDVPGAVFMQGYSVLDGASVPSSYGNWSISSSDIDSITFVSKTANSNVTNFSVAGGTFTTNLGVISPQAIVEYAAGSALTLNSLASDGTFELTGVNAGTTTLALTGAASGTEDVLNIKLNGTSSIINTGKLNVADVETIHIVTADSNNLSDPASASKINLVDAAATAVTVSGNHGVTFTGSTLTNVTSLDASGVNSTLVSGSGVAGAVTFTSQVIDKAVTVVTGNGNDVIDLRSVTSTSAGASVSTGMGNDKVWGTSGTDHITTGDGNDTVYSSGGSDIIDLGSGDDTFVLNMAPDSGSTISGGDGIDTLSMSAANASALSASSALANTVDGFEMLSIGAVVGSGATATVDLANLDNINYVVSGGTTVGASFETDVVKLFSIAPGAAYTIGGVTVKSINGTVSAADVASAFAGTYTGSALSITGSNPGWTTTADAKGNVINTATAAGNPTNLITTFSSNTNAAPAAFGVVTTDGTASSTETATVTINAVAAGQRVTIAGITLWAQTDLTADQVLKAFLGQDGVAAIMMNGTLSNAAKIAPADVLATYSGWTVASNSGNTITYASTTANSNVANLATSLPGAFGGAAPTETVTNQTYAAELSVAHLASNGTFELTGANLGSTTLSVSGADSGTADVLNIKLNGTSNIVNTGNLNVSDVENIHITTATSGTPSAASVIKLVDAAATTITVDGNHGMDFTGSTLTNLVTLDASGVTATGAAASVTFKSHVADQAVVVITAGGNDAIDLRSVTSTSVGASVNTGAGNDTVWGTASNDIIKLGAGNDTVYSSTGADTITLGDGNDVYVLQSASNSTQSMSDTITDFFANTVAGASVAAGATSTLANLNGDTISVTVGSLATAGITVNVVSNAADALAFLQSTSAASTTNHTTGIALDSTTGKLYIDLDADGTADSVITLTGVNTITEAAFVVTH